MVVELYDATLKDCKEMFKNMKATSGIPTLHIGIDLWTSTASGDKFIGDCCCDTRNIASLRHLLRALPPLQTLTCTTHIRFEVSPKTKVPGDTA